MENTATPLSVKPTRWLIGQSRTAWRWIALSIGLGVANGFLVIFQAKCIARIIHGTVMEGIARTDQEGLFALLLAFVGLRAALRWGREITGFLAGSRIREEIRMDLLEHIASLGPAFIARRKVGALTSAVMEQVEGLHGFFAYYLPQLALAAAIPIAMLIFVFPISWAAGGLLLISAPLIPLFMILVGMGAESISQRHFQSLSRMSAHFLDTLRGLSTLKLLDRSREEESSVAKVSDNYRRKTMAVLRIAFLSSAVLEFFSSISIAMVAVYLGTSFLGYTEFGAWGRQLTLEHGFFILLIAPDYFLPLRDLGTHYHTRAEAIGAAKGILAILRDHGQKKTDGSDTLSLREPLNISCENLRFAYEDGKRPALNDVTFHLKTGEKVALVGESGAGKSTIINLLLGFVTQDQGIISINGAPLESLSMESWRRYIAWIGQDPVLLQGTVRDNIIMGRPDASEFEVAEAARAAVIYDFISDLKNGFDTEVHEAAYGFSRGQAQRIALARAYLKDAPLLLLDEPYSGLDTENERLVMNAVTALSRDRTVLLLTHRLSGLKNMDRIMVMAEGRIVQIGTWSELSQVEGEFRRLLRKEGEELPHG